MRDVRDAFRALRATSVVSVIAVLSLALGIGANTAIFSILDSLLLRSLPVRDPQRLGLVTRATGQIASWTNPIWEQVRDREPLFEGAFAWSSGRFNLAQGGMTDLVDGLWASGRYFEVLGVPAMLGRVLTPSDDRRGGGADGPVTVISYAFWQRRFAGAADVIGRTLTIEGVPFTIVGVTGPDFFGAEVGRTFDVAIPIGTQVLVRGKESTLDSRSHWWLNVMVRLRTGQTHEAASAALSGVLPQIREATMPGHYREEDKVRYLQEGMAVTPAATGTSALRRRYQQPLLTIMVVVALVLVIACANIANLLLARAAARRHEISVRLALGASRLRLTRMLLTESLVLAGLGALAGLAFAAWGSRLLVRQLSTSTSYVFLELPLDWRVLGFTTGVAGATALLFGTVPALRATRVQPSEALNETGRGIAGDRRFGLGNALVIAQVALSLTLVVAAGLFLRTFGSLARLDLGFDRGPVLVASVDAQRLQLEPGDRSPLFERLRSAAEQLPGVAHASLSVVTPVSGSSWQYGVDAVDGVPVPGGDQARSVYVNLVSRDWFTTYGTRILAGRDFTDADVTGPEVAIVNQAFARKFTDNENPVGRRIQQEGRPSRAATDRLIIGYVEDAVYRSLREAVPPTMYLLLPQQPDPPSFVSISVRAAAGSPLLLTRALAAALADVNRDLAITVRPLSEQVNASLIQDRMVAMLSGFFGGLALLLAGLGLYGVTSYAVNRRRTEIGIRMALGAEPGAVVRLVLRRVAWLVGAGIVAGTAFSLWASRFVSTLLFDLQPRDPATLAGATLVLAAIGVLAGWLPARRASRIHPSAVLRT
ncbi:MAG TPA: ABC transporter permease [Vicinamibacterales bacterium]|nr:ABC transporter permease [Vicinamibacterales bacterium]